MRKLKLYLQVCNTCPSPSLRRASAPGPYDNELPFVGLDDPEKKKANKQLMIPSCT